jgi:enoyl-CoA hydratase/carnithine racemase
MSDYILLECQPPLATVIINRPRQRNAISYSMWGNWPGYSLSWMPTGMFGQ